MNREMNTTILLIQNAQLRDELSDAHKQIDSIQVQLNQADSDKQAALLQIRQEYEDKMSLMEAAYIREIEQRDQKMRTEINQIKESSRMKLLEKEQEIERLQESNVILAGIYSKSIVDESFKNDNLRTSLSNSNSQIDWYKQKHWGRSSEQAALLQNRTHVTRRSEKEMYLVDNIASQMLDTSELDVTRKERRRLQRQFRDYVKNKPYTASPQYIRLADYYTPSEGERLKKRNGVVEKRIKRIIKMVPAHFEETFIEVATIRSNGEERDSYIIEDQVIPGVPFDTEMISFILTEHYRFHTTWANIAKKLQCYGVHISDSSLGNIAHRCISYLKNLMSQAWIEELYKTDYWMIDETTSLVGITDKDTGNRNYMTKYLWGIRANKQKLSWFIYDNGSRGRKVIRPFLDKFRGYFTTDGYIVYKMYEKDLDSPQKRCACLTHIRRLFIECLHENRGIASWFINKIKKLFSIDSDCKKREFTGPKRAYARVCRSSVIMKEIEDKYNFYIHNGAFHKLGRMTQRALTYISHEWSAMKNVIEFGDAELSNNLCEQMMRHVKINLKNSQNIGSEECAQNFCFMYSLIESCDFNHLSPIKYISYLLKALHGSDVYADHRSLLPCNCEL